MISRLSSRQIPTDVVDYVHVIFPEDVYVHPDQILSWAHDALVNAAVSDHVKSCGPISIDADGDLIYQSIVNGVPKLTDLDEAKAILDDLGTHTFARS